MSFENLHDFKNVHGCKFWNLMNIFFNPMNKKGILRKKLNRWAFLHIHEHSWNFIQKPFHEFGKNRNKEKINFEFDEQILNVVNNFWNWWSFFLFCYQFIIVFQFFWEIPRKKNNILRLFVHIDHECVYVSNMFVLCNVFPFFHFGSKSSYPTPSTIIGRPYLLLLSSFCCCCWGICFHLLLYSKSHNFGNIALWIQMPNSFPIAHCWNSFFFTMKDSPKI